MGHISLSGQNIIVTSNEPWGYIWFSKHNYAYELSKYNKVIFINPTAKWHLKNILGCKITTANYSSNLTILTYNNVLPILNRLLFHSNNYFVSKKLYRFFKKINFTQPLLWSFDPYRLSNPNLLGVTYSIFHAVDLYDFTRHGEISFCKRVNAIFCIANALIQQYSVFGTPVYLVPHGISNEEFLVTDEPVDSSYTQLSEYGLYIGNIDSRINFSLLESMLIKFPDTPFLFIGKLNLPPTNSMARKIFMEGNYKNLHYQGAIPFKKLKYFIAKAKFCMAIMDSSILGNVISHHKILQYLAFGKPVFGCNFSEYQNIHELLYMSNDDDRILQKMQDFLIHGEGAGLVKKRIQYAKYFTFEEIFSRVEKYINS